MISLLLPTHPLQIKHLLSSYTKSGNIDSLNTHTHTVLTAIFRVNLSLPVPFDIQSTMIPILSIHMGQAKTLHIHLDAIPPSPPWMSPPPGSLKYILDHLSQPASSLRSTCPNHRNLPLLIVKLTGSSPNSPLISVFFLLSFKLKPNIHLSILISFLSNFASISTFIGQVSLP